MKTVFYLPIALCCLLTMNDELPPNPIHKPGFTLAFDDEFSEPVVDTSKWMPFYLPQWSSRKISAAQYDLKNGNLVLKITQDQMPWCKEFNGGVKCSSFQTGLFAGALNTDIGQHKINPACVVREEQQVARLFTPRYGYFEIRAKAAIDPNNVAAFWMIGFEDVPQHSSEICIMEIKGENIEKGKLVNGYGVRKFNDPVIKDQFYEESFPIDATKFNIYAAEWSPNKIDFFINNKKVRTIHQSPAYEMQFMLNIYEIPNEDGTLTLNEPYPKELTVDYVRAYKRNKEN